MMAQDMTKVILVLVLLGACLAVAVFRPQILPPLTPTPASPASPGFSTAPQDRADQSANPQAQSNPAQPELTPTPEGLTSMEAELERWAGELKERQAALDRREEELDKRQVALDRREEELNRRETELNRWEAAVAQRGEQLAERERSLDRQEASIAAEREELNRLWRWVLAVAVITGLLALPSLLALYLLWKVNRESAELARSAQAAREGASWKAASSGQPTAAVESLSGGNGRGQREKARPR